MLLDSQFDLEEILAVYVLWELLSFVPAVTTEQQEHLTWFVAFFHVF